MDPTTQAGAESAQQSFLPPDDPARDADLADQFQSLFDRGAFEPTDENGNDLPGQEPGRRRAPEQRAEREGDGERTEQSAEGEQEGEQAQGADEKGADEQDRKAEQEDGGKLYQSLDEYLKDQKLDPESFMQLPVAVKVDGKEQSVPLAEVVKGYQLSSTAYDRLQQLAAERHSFTGEQAQVRQALGVRIKQIETLLNHAQQLLLGDYQRVDWAKLRTESPGEYAALSTEFQSRRDAIQQTLQQIAQAQSEQAQQAENARLQAIPAEHAKLLAARPDWRDPAKALAAHRDMVRLGRSLGFTDAELNSVYDHRMLLVLDMAARYAQLQASKPQQLKRVRAAPQMAKSGTRQQRSPQGVRIQQARERWQRSGYHDDDAAAALLEQIG